MDSDELVAQCVDAIAETEPRLAIRSVLERALASSELADTVGSLEPGLNVLHNTAELTVLNVVWPPLVSLFPHEHRMWAAIGIYGGREDNAFYRRDGSTHRRVGREGAPRGRRAPPRRRRDPLGAQSGPGAHRRDPRVRRRLLRDAPQPVGRGDAASRSRTTSPTCAPSSNGPSESSKRPAAA